MLEIELFDRFLRVPGPASYGQTLTTYPSSSKFPEDGGRVRCPGDVEGYGAARGLDVETHRPGLCLGLFGPGQLLCGRLPRARRPALASRVRRDRSFARHVARGDTVGPTPAADQGWLPSVS